MLQFVVQCLLAEQVVSGGFRHARGQHFQDQYQARFPPWSATLSWWWGFAL